MTQFSELEDELEIEEEEEESGESESSASTEITGMRNLPKLFSKFNELKMCRYTKQRKLNTSKLPC